MLMFGFLVIQFRMSKRYQPLPSHEERAPAVCFCPLSLSASHPSALLACIHVIILLHDPLWDELVKFCVYS